MKRSRSRAGWRERENRVAKIDYEYETNEEKVRAYLQVPVIERLRWLEELCALTYMVREAPTTYRAESISPAPEERGAKP